MSTIASYEKATGVTHHQLTVISVRRLRSYRLNTVIDSWTQLRPRVNVSSYTVQHENTTNNGAHYVLGI